MSRSPAPLLLALSLATACPPQEDGFLTRAESLEGITKVDPADDVYPPMLSAALADEFEDPVPYEGPVNSAGAEDSPFWVPGRGLYFFFTPDPQIDVTLQVLDGVTGLWWSEGGDGEPERVKLAERSGESMDGCGAWHAGELWFCSIRGGNFNEIDWWIAPCDGADCEEPVNAGEAVNLELMPGELHMLDDEVWFGSDRDGGEGGQDLWFAERDGDGWGPATNAGAPPNDGATQMMPAFGPDPDELWWNGTSNQGQPGPALWRSTRVDGAWSEPEEVISSFAGEPTITDDGDLVFVHHYYTEGPGEMLEADLYIARRR
jgi:hypothetical protein